MVFTVFAPEATVPGPCRTAFARSREQLLVLTGDCSYVIVHRWRTGAQRAGRARPMSCQSRITCVTDEARGGDWTLSVICRLSSSWCTPPWSVSNSVAVARVGSIFSTETSGKQPCRTTVRWLVLVASERIGRRQWKTHNGMMLALLDEGETNCVCETSLDQSVLASS